MSMHVITADHVIYHFTPDMEPKWRVPADAEVEIHCVDGLGGTIQTEDDKYVAVDYDHVNDATGPIFVEGAEPGDILSFTIDAIRVASDQGCTLLIPGFGLHGEQITEACTRISKMTNTSALVLGRFEVPLRPMLGTIGVAPREGRWDTVTPHDHGGNLDTSDVRAGVRVFFPVNQPGALLAMGDAKAVMGDGEVCSTGVEVPVVVTGRLQVLRGRSIERPMIETETKWMTIGSAKEYLDAVPSRKRRYGPTARRGERPVLGGCLRALERCFRPQGLAGRRSAPHCALLRPQGVREVALRGPRRVR